MPLSTYNKNVRFPNVIVFLKPMLVSRCYYTFWNHINSWSSPSSSQNNGCVNPLYVFSSFVCFAGVYVQRDKIVRHPSFSLDISCFLFLHVRYESLLKCRTSNMVVSLLEARFLHHSHVSRRPRKLLLLLLFILLLFFFNLMGRYRQNSISSL